MKKFSYFMILWAVLIGYTANAQTCSTTVNIPANGTTMVNGIQVTSSTTGVYSVLVPFSTCDGSNFSSGSLSVGASGLWEVNLTFSQPVNNLVIALLGIENNDIFNFNSNTGNVSITYNNSNPCNSLTINNNQIIGNGTTTSGTFKISTLNPFTKLTINGFGAVNSGSSLIGICSASLSTLSVDDVNGKAKNNTVDIYPNPVKSMMTITSKENLKGYKVFDGSGKLMISSSSLKGNKQEADISSLKTGNYIITVEIENQKVNKKFIKE